MSTNSDKPYVGDPEIGSAQRAVNAVYLEAGQTPDNELSCVHVARALHRYYAEGADWSSALRISLRDLRRQFGLDQQPLPPTGPGPGPAPRLDRGARVLLADRRPLRVRGCSAFRLPKLMADGEIGQVDDFVGFCVEHDMPWLVVFSMCMNEFGLAPEVGVEAVDALAERTAATGARIDVCALVDTFAYSRLDVAAHVADIGQLAWRWPHLSVTVANEPMQRWQRFEPAELRDAAEALVDAGVPFTLGAPDGPADESRAYTWDKSWYETVHIDRTKAPWRNVRHSRELQVLMEETNRYVISREPMRAEEVTAEQNFALRSIAAVCRFGDVYHSVWGKRCAVPNVAEVNHLAQGMAAWAAVPDDFEGAFANFGWTAPLPESPVVEFAFVDSDSRCYSLVGEREGYVAAVHGEVVRLRDGWTGGPAAAVGGSSVWRCERT